jgi:hypothetical protein
MPSALRRPPAVLRMVSAPPPKCAGVAGLEYLLDENTGFTGRHQANFDDFRFHTHQSSDGGREVHRAALVVLFRSCLAGLSILSGERLAGVDAALVIRLDDNDGIEFEAVLRGPDDRCTPDMRR